MLSKLRVLEISSPETMLAGQLLADLGADVIVVEPPAGSAARRLEPFVDDLPGLERSLVWLAYNHNKRGITLDLRQADGRALLSQPARKGTRQRSEARAEGDGHRREAISAGIDRGDLDVANADDTARAFALAVSRSQPDGLPEARKEGCQSCRNLQQLLAAAVCAREQGSQDADGGLAGGFEQRLQIQLQITIVRQPRLRLEVEAHFDVLVL